MGLFLPPEVLLIQAGQRAEGWPGLQLGLVHAAPWSRAGAHILLGEDSGPEGACSRGHSSQTEVGLNILPSALVRVHGPQLTGAEQDWAEQVITEAAWEGPWVPDHRHWALSASGAEEGCEGRML